MPTYFPQINSNYILTQLPYTVSRGYRNVNVQMDTGMRWGFPFRANGVLPGNYPPGPLSGFQLAFSSISDAEVVSLQTFFRSMQGRYGTFRFFDPGGNLLQYSEDFSQSYWDKSGGVTVLSNDSDPFGGTKATFLIGANSNSQMLGIVGPSDGGYSGFLLCASAWIKPSITANVGLGFIDSVGTTIKRAIFRLRGGVWTRIFYNTIAWDNNYFRVILGGNGTWPAFDLEVYGFQCSPMKGEGAYVRTPGNYGYHANCRFDTDTFQRTSLGPNQNQVVLPVREFNA